MNIGDWIRRPGQKWHRVESTISNAAITRCGRRMEPLSSWGRLEISSVEPLTRAINQPQLCKRCA